MKLKNFEILNANAVLGELVDEKLKGKLKFKLFKTKRALEDAYVVILKTLEGVDGEEERTEILEESQELTIDLFTYDELEPLPLSTRQLSSLILLVDEGESNV